MSDEYSDRLRVLEEKFEYQEQTVDSLSDVIIDQQKQLTLLTNQVHQLRSQLAGTQEDTPAGEEPPPPHY
ncbi:MAG: SlyX protein [Desulforhopalus sp.]|jgi:SlyX protein